MPAEVIVDIIGRDNFSGVLGNFGSIITGIESAVNLVGRAFDAAVDAITPFIDSAVESQDAIAELEAVLRATGGAAGLSSEELQSMANELQNVTRFGDETIMSGQSMLLTFRNIGEETFPRATQAMLDMAEMFGNVDTAAIQLGKALNDPIAGIGALQRIGIQFTEEQRTMIENFMEVGDVAAAQNVILREVEMQLGGLAQAMGGTFAGQVAILRNRFDEIRETIGNALLPILAELAAKLLEHMPAIEDFGQQIANWITELGESGNIQEFADRVFDATDKLLNLASAFIDAGANSSEFREALSLIFGDNLQISQQDVVDFLDRIDAQLAEAVRAHDWRASGEAFGDALQGFLTGDGLQSADSQAIPAIAEALSDWFLGAAGLMSWDEFDDVLINGFVTAMNGLEVEGTNAVRDFFNGIEVSVTDAIRDWFNNIELDVTDWVRDHIVTPFKRALGIASPSTVFMEIGRDIIRGLIGGLDSMVGWAIGQIEGIVAALLEPFNDVLDLIGSGSTGTIGGRIGEAIDTRSAGGLGSMTAVRNPDGSTSGSGAILNFYGPVYVGSLNELNYDCGAVSPLLQSSIGLSGNGIG